MTKVKMPEPELFTHELITNGGGVYLGVAEKGICERSYVEGETSALVHEWVLLSTAKQYGDDRAREALEMAAKLCVSLAVTACNDSNITRLECASAIRNLKKQIKLLTPSHCHAQ